MDITFNCDKCGQSLTIAQAGAGAIIECPKCSESVLVPGIPAPEPEQPTPSTPQNLRRCPDCGREVSKRAAACPHCGAPLSTPSRSNQRPRAFVQATPADAGTVSEGNIAAAYILAPIVPFIGFFAGIYLLAKKEPGHGVVCMAISVVASFFWIALLRGC